jgi:tetratricopeptide (TPR) repeat protein
VPLFKEYLTTHPDDLQARVGLGDALADAGRLHAALSQYRVVLARKLGELGAQYGAARVLGWMGRYRAAERIYRAILARHPHAFAAQSGLAQVENWYGYHRAAARAMGRLLRTPPGHAGLRHDLATAQYWSGFNDLALATLGGSRVPGDVTLRRHIRNELAPTVSASLDGSTDSDRLHIVGVTLNAQYHFGATRWLGLAYRVARLQQDNPAIPADNRLYGREVLVSGGQRIGSLNTPWGTVWPSLALGVRKYSNWQTFAWRANAKWIPADLWRVDLYSGNEVIENIRSIRNQATFRSLDVDVSWQALPRLNLGIGAGAGTFDDRSGDRNIRRRFRSHVLGVLHFHPRIFAEWSFLYFNDSNPNVQVGYYNPDAYWEHRATLGFSTRWHGFALAARGGMGRLTEGSGSSDWLYFWQASLGRDLGSAGGLRLVVGRTDSKQLASTSSAGYRRAYLSLGYIYRF